MVEKFQAFFKYFFYPEIKVFYYFSIYAFGDFIFLCAKMKRAGYNWPSLRPVQKRAPLRGACTAQIVFGGHTMEGGLQILGVLGSGCESDSHAVRDGFG